MGKGEWSTQSKALHLTVASAGHHLAGRYETLTAHQCVYYYHRPETKTSVPCPMSKKNEILSNLESALFVDIYLHFYSKSESDFYPFVTSCEKYHTLQAAQGC